MNRNVWNSLSQFQSFDLVQRQFQRRHRRQLNAERTWEIISCFIQGKEYFANAQSAAESVRPLLLYYGVLAISRGVILFLNEQSREATLSQGHGLREIGWRGVLSAGISNVLELEVKVQEGTFLELAAATENRTLATLPVAGGAVEIAGWRPVLGESAAGMIKLGDLLSRIPDVRDAYRDVTEQPGNTLFGVVVSAADAHVVRVAQDPVAGLTTEADVRQVFQVPNNVQVGLWPPADIFPIPNFGYRLPRVAPGSSPAAMPMPENFSEYHHWLVAPWPNGGHMSALLRCYATSFFLGTLVRYFPSCWMALIRNEKGDAALPLMREAIDHVESGFPRLALDALGLSTV